MEVKNIRAVRNGYVASAQESHWDYDKDENVVTEFECIALTLRELADTLEPTTKPSDHVQVNLRELQNAKDLAMAGRKIDAIKWVRNAFNPRMSLKDAKEFVEMFWPKEPAGMNLGDILHEALNRPHDPLDE